MTARDISQDAIGFIEGDTDAMREEAKKIVMILWACYPGHRWKVRVTKYLLHIKHLNSGAGPWGMALHLSDVDHDWAVMKHQVVMKAGEWLERAGMRRGANWEYEEPTQLIEGVPMQHQSPEFKPPVRAVEGEKSESV